MNFDVHRLKRTIVTREIIPPDYATEMLKKTGGKRIDNFIMRYWRRDFLIGTKTNRRHAEITNDCHECNVMKLFGHIIRQQQITGRNGMFTMMVL